VTRVVVFGATSLVGSDFVEQAGFECLAFGRTDPRSIGLEVAGFEHGDVTDPAAVARHITGSEAEIVLNFAARTDVNQIELERGETSGAGRRDSAWNMNVLAAEAMAERSAASGKRFVTISTDYVFDGESGPYAEEAVTVGTPDRVTWYGWTKAESERRVLRANPRSTILRISFPYRTRFGRKVDFARRMIEWYCAGSVPPLFRDQHIRPTWIPDVTAMLSTVVREDLSGVLHVASPTATTPWEFGTELLSQFAGHPVTPPTGSLVEANARPGAVPRPRNGGLSCSRASRLGIHLTPWQEGVRAVASEARRTTVTGLPG
jgi:dTDP-4-dehydrorhamnose reductase